MKPFLKYISMGCLLSMTSFVQAQNKCPPVSKDLYQDLNVASVMDKPQITKELLTKNCFDLEVFKKNNFTFPAFYSKNLENILIYEATKTDLLALREPSTELDLISYFLLNPNYILPVGKREQEIAEKWAKKYNVSIGNFDFKVSPVEREKIISYLANKYSGLNNSSKDTLGNSNLTYAVQTGEYKAIKPLLGLASSTQGIYKKNNVGLAPIHMVFFMDYIVNPNKQEAIEKTNDALLETLTNGRILYAKYDKLAFFDFAELMKDKNPDFYNKLKRKFFFKSTIKPEAFADLRQRVIADANNVAKLKKISDGPENNR